MSLSIFWNAQGKAGCFLSGQLHSKHDYRSGWQENLPTTSTVLLPRQAFRKKQLPLRPVTTPQSDATHILLKWVASL